MVVPSLPLDLFVRKVQELFFFSLPRVPGALTTGHSTVDEGHSCGHISPFSPPSSLACPSTCGLNHAKTTHMYLREVPALDEVTGHIASCLAMDCRGYVMPRHPGVGGLCQWNLPRCTRQGSTLTGPAHKAHVNHLTPALTPTMIH